jgi:hypothetical protein
MWEKHKDAFRSPCSHTEWNKILDTLVWATENCGDPEVVSAASRSGLIPRSVAAACIYSRELFQTNGPVRYVSTEIAEAFLNTGIPSVTAKMMDVYPCFLLVPPKNLIVDDENGLCIESMIVITGPIAAVRDCEGESMSGVMIVGFSGTKVLMTSAFIGAKMFDSRETRSAVQLQMASIVVNTLMTYLYEPELIEDDNASGHQRHTQHRSRRGRAREPIWIGKNFRVTRRSAQGGAGSSAPGAVSLRPHWRRGHWHTVVCGERRQERRVKWFRPVFVTGSAWSGA